MKVGIIGLGARIAHVAHEFYKTAPDLEFVAYSDPAPAGQSVLQSQLGKPLQGYETPQEMFAAHKLDLVLIGSPNFLHLEHIKVALESPTPYIFTEKPVIISKEETFKLLELMAKHNGLKRLLIGLVLRYSPLFRQIRESQNSGQIGDIISIEAAEHIAPYHGSFFMKDWRRHSKYSGGFMLEKCCHDLDLYQGIIGARPIKLASFGGRKFFTPQNKPEKPHRFPAPEYPDRVDPFTPRWNGSEADFDSDGDLIDYQTALIEYEGGANLCFHTNMAVADEYRRFAIIGTNGMAEGDFVRNYYRVHDAMTSEELVHLDDLGGNRSGHYGADSMMSADIIAYIRGEADLPVGIIDALQAGLTALMLDEARHSSSVIDMAPIWQQFDSYKLS
ncbi:Gfo/Idh/MocA family protein [Polycladidibacter hongkongensis]|uniref:Gfo/Idh/MocA family protein n=1 Tax=Polycladidibacter hongkongensis TaxID=1647556 RepID=UPI00082A812B|nr:Gfo/Idh/MocA family oxidoreductase [Pseudovibrio hongkongensis]